MVSATTSNNCRGTALSSKPPTRSAAMCKILGRGYGETRRIASNIAKLPTWGQATFLLSELPGSGRAPSEPFGTSNRTFKGVMRSNGG